MLKSNVYRVLCKDNFKTVLLRLYSSKNNQDGNKADGSSTKDVKSNESNATDDITSKINKLLMDMAENKSSITEENVKKYSLANDDLGIERSRKPPSQKPKKKLSPEQQLKNAAADAADSISVKDKAQIENDLVTKAFSATPTNLDWGNLIAGMNVDKTNYDEKTTRSKQVHQAQARYGDFKPRHSPGDDSFRSPKLQTIDVFGGKPLDIFQTVGENTGTKLETWSRLCNYELKLTASHPPNNYFQKMIQWTEQGKLWKFPIDNEQGLEEEQNIHFSEHIFLEAHLEGWCPQKGPIRHFMELVCVGLSKNPYLPVKDKREHIEWFKDYFLSKKDLLSEVGALGKDSSGKPLTLG